MLRHGFRVRLGTGFAVVALLLAGLAARPAAAQDETGGAPDMGKLSFEALTARPSRPLISHAYADENQGWTRHAGPSHVAVRHARWAHARLGHARLGHVQLAHARSSRVATRHVAWHGSRHEYRTVWTRHAEIRRVSAVRHLGHAAPSPRRHRR